MGSELLMHLILHSVLIQMVDVCKEHISSAINNSIKVTESVFDIHMVEACRNMAANPTRIGYRNATHSFHKVSQGCISAHTYDR